MSIPFTGEEVQGAAKRLKNGKSGNGSDTLHAEFIKYANEKVHEYTADIFNGVADTGEHPEELKMGILTPLEKPGKKQKIGGEGDHLRPHHVVVCPAENVDNMHHTKNMGSTEAKNPTRTSSLPRRKEWS